MNYNSKILSDTYALEFQEVGAKKSVIAFFLGMAIIAASIFLGASYAFYIPFLVFSLFITLLWRKAPRPWIYLVSISAAVPIAISRKQFTCNLIFALWFAVLNRHYFFKLPKWVKISTVLAIIGILTSAINWMSGDIISSLMRQGAYAYNILLAPFLFIPMIFIRMKESKDHEANLQGLLFCLIIPSTLVLVSARLFGTVANEWEASQHTLSLSEGFLQYQLVKVVVDFLRTQVGFILAALICASTAVAISQVKNIYRFLAVACLISNAVLLLLTGSFGSGFACICGLLTIFATQIKKVSVARALGSLVVIVCVLLVSYNFLPESIKDYLGKRYEHRVTDADTDRLVLWSRAMDQFIKHPEGVGLTLEVGDQEKSFIHNEYLVYAVSYGFVGGLGYLFLVLGLLKSYLKMRKRTFDNPSALAVYLAGLGVLVAIALNTITDHLNSNRWYFNICWSIIWYCYFCTCSNSRLLKMMD